jgi:hypothetical protein
MTVRESGNGLLDSIHAIGRDGLLLYPVSRAMALAAKRGWVELAVGLAFAAFPLPDEGRNASLLGSTALLQRSSYGGRRGSTPKPVRPELPD